MKVDHIFADFTGVDVNDNQILEATNFPLPRNFDCLKAMVDTYNTFCAKLDDYSLKYVKYFVKECEELKPDQSYDEIVNKLKKSC